MPGSIKIAKCPKRGDKIVLLTQIRCHSERLSENQDTKTLFVLIQNCWVGKAKCKDDSAQRWLKATWHFLWSRCEDHWSLSEEVTRKPGAANKLISFWKCCWCCDVGRGDVVISGIVIVLLPHYHVLAPSLPLLSLLAAINNPQISWPESPGTLTLN